MWYEGNIDSRYGIGGGSTCSGAPPYYAIDEYGGTHPVNEKPAGQKCPKCGTFAEFPKRLCDNCFAKEEVERLKRAIESYQQMQKQMVAKLGEQQSNAQQTRWMLSALVKALREDNRQCDECGGGPGPEVITVMNIADNFLKGSNAPQV